MREVFSEARRRRVFGTAGLYAAGAFVVWQVADIALPALGLPDVILTLLVVSSVAGMPAVLVLAWVYDLRKTDAGLQMIRTRPLDSGSTLTSLVGRSDELRRLEVLLADESARLVTVVGPGGIGKTRLLLEALARGAVPQAMDVVQVSLDDAENREVLVSRLGRSLGLRLSGTSEPADRVIGSLRARERLLVLDGCEGLVHEAPFVLSLLQASPRSKILSTSRIPFSVAAEHVLPLRGLAHAADGPDDADRLFVAVARRSGAIVGAWGSEEKDTVRRICTMVDGNPLAIELAGAWSGSLGLGEIERGIREGTDILESGGLDRPERQRSLRSVLDAAWRRLEPEDAGALADLSIFEAAFNREGARAVAGAGAGRLRTLAGRSCLRRGAEGMWVVPRMVREHARRQDPRWPRQSLRERHGAHVASRLRETVHDLGSSGHDQALARFDRELEDVRRAWDHALEVEAFSRIEEMIGPLRRGLDQAGRMKEGRDLFSDAADRFDDSGENQNARRLRGRLLGVAGYFSRAIGDLAESVRALQESLAILVPLGPTVELAFSLNAMGDVSALLGRSEDAHTFCRKAHSIFEAAGDERGLAGTANNLGVTAHRLGRFEEARSHYERSLAACQALGDRHGAAFAMNNLGVLDHETGDLGAAEGRYREAREVAASVRDRHGVAAAQVNLARVALARGDAEEAIRWAETARGTFDEQGNVVHATVAVLALADAAIQLGRWSEAAGHFREALRSALGKDAQPLMGEALVGLAEVMLHDGAEAGARKALLPTLDCDTLDADAVSRRERLRTTLGDLDRGEDGAGLRETARHMLDAIDNTT